MPDDRDDDDNDKNSFICYYCSYHFICQDFMLRFSRNSDLTTVAASYCIYRRDIEINNISEICLKR